MQFYVFGANNFTFESLNLKETAIKFVFTQGQGKRHTRLPD